MFFLGCGGTWFTINPCSLTVGDVVGLMIFNDFVLLNVDCDSELDVGLSSRYEHVSVRLCKGFIRCVYRPVKQVYPIKCIIIQSQHNSFEGS